MSWSACREGPSRTDADERYSEPGQRIQIVTLIALQYSSALLPNIPLKLNLLENSQAFFRESVANATAAKEDIRKWQFAIVNLVQALELSVKALLHKKHAVFIYEDIDQRKHTVSITRALERLVCPEIGGLSIPEPSLRRMKKAIELRNEIMHRDYELALVYAESKFLEVFALVARFQTQYLGTQLRDILSAEDLRGVLEMKKGLELMAEQAILRIQEEGHPQHIVIACIVCSAQTFVIDGVDRCFTCGHEEEVSNCPRCHKPTFFRDLEDFSDAFDRDLSRSHYDYGCFETFACSGCEVEIRRSIYATNHAYWASSSSDEDGYW